MVKTRKINILHVHGDLTAGGGQVLSREWLTRFRQDKFNCFVVVLGEPETLKESFERNSISVTKIYGNRLKQIIELSKFIRDNNIDVIHTQSEPDRKVGHWAGFITSTPVVAHLHSSWVYFKPVRSQSFLKNAKSYLSLALRKLSEKSVVQFIATSPDVKREFEKNTDKDIAVVEPGIDINQKPIGESDKGKFRSSLGVLPGQKLIVNASRLDRLKNIEDFVVAVSKLKAEHDVVGLIFGEGECKFGIEKLIGELDAKDYVKVFPPTTDLNRVLSIADFYLAPSLSESFGMSVLEAMSVGLPVVSYALPAYERYGNAIRTVPKSDVDQLVSEISQLILNDEERNQLVELELLESRNYDICKGAEALEKIYVHLAKKDREK